jgi:hypothetical protein
MHMLTPGCVCWGRIAAAALANITSYRSSEGFYQPDRDHLLLWCEPIEPKSFTA